MTDKKNDVIKIVQVKSKDRIIFPKGVREVMHINKGDHIAFLKDNQPGIRIQKVSFEDFNNSTKK